MSIDDGPPEVLDSPLSIWSFLVRHGGIDPKNYDQPLIDEIRTHLALPEEGDFEQLLASNVSVEAFVVAFFKAVAPYAAMMSDLFVVFERAGVKRSNQSMRIDYDFGASVEPLRFDLEHFKEWLKRWRSVSETLFSNQWNRPLLWEIPSAFPDSNHRLLDTGIQQWLREYRAGRWPKSAPPLPISGNLELDTRLERLWPVLLQVLEESARYGAGHDALREASRSAVPEPGENAPSWPPDLLWQLEGDYWAGSVVQNAHSLARRASSEQPAAMAASIESAILKLDDIWRRVPKLPITQDRLASVLWAVLSLPFWQMRHELYSTWVFTQILEALGCLPVRIHVLNGSLKFSFSGSHLATVDLAPPRLHVWAEMRSPLTNPRSKKRTGGIQPDYSLVTDPITAPEASILEIECKQYLKPSATNFSDALTDYAKGRPNAVIVLVNYGGVTDSILDRVDPEVRHRTHMVGHLHPGSAGAKDQFNTLLRTVLETHFRLPPITALPASASGTLGSTAEITLTWNAAPRDLDLHLRVERSRAASLINYSERGRPDADPFVSHEGDVQHGFGPERIGIAKWLDGKYYCAVHNYSNDAPLAASGARVTLRSGSVARDYFCPAQGAGAWWLVFRIDPQNGLVHEFNQIVEFPWRERTIFEEDFSDNRNKWSETFHELAVRDGAYLFSHQRPDKSWLTWKTIRLEDASDFRIEAAISRTAGVEGSYYGLIWGLQDADHLYAFTVRSDRSFRIYRQDDNSLDPLVDWQKFPFLPGDDTPTRLAVEKSGDRLLFQIDGRLVHDLPFRNFFGPNIGFLVYSQVSIRVHTLKVTQLYAPAK